MTDMPDTTSRFDSSHTKGPGEQSYDEYLADPETCSAFPEAVQSYWIGENGDESGQGGQG